MNGKYRVMFLRDEKTQPVGCLAIETNPDKMTVTYQMSVLHPTDRFNRKTARQLALGRMMEDPITLKLTRVSGHDISAAIMNDIVTYSHINPSRAVKAAKAWLRNAESKLAEKKLNQGLVTTNRMTSKSTLGT